MSKQMKSVPIDELVKIVEFWVNQEWPMTKTEGLETCRNVGWLQNDDGSFRTPYGFQVDRVFLSEDKGINELSLINFRVSDVNLDESAEKSAEMNDIFAEYFQAFTLLYGKPKTLRRKDYQRASWLQLANGCRVDLTRAKTSLSCCIFSPGYAEVERYLGERRL